MHDPYYYLTAKYDASTGALQTGWPVVRTSESGQAVAIAVGDAYDNVYVTGYVLGGANGTRWGTIQYSGGANQNWIAYVDGGKDVRPADIAVDVNGISFVCGQWADATVSTGDDYLTVSYPKDYSGIERWRTAYTRNYGDSADRATAIGLQYDVAGSALYCFVTGETGDDLTNQHDYGTLKYSASTGTSQWAGDGCVRYNNSGDDRASSIAVAGNGNSYVTGFSHVSGIYGYATLRYNNTGSQISAIRYDNASGDSKAQKVVVSGAGNAHVTGFSPGTGIDFRSAKYYQSNATGTAPGGYSTVVGSHVSGDYTSLGSSDNSYLVTQWETGPAVGVYKIIVEASAIVPSAATELSVTIEAKGSEANMLQVVEFYDYVSGIWRTMDSGPVTTSDSVLHINVACYDPSRFLQDVDTAAVKVRVKYKQTGAFIGVPTVSIDQIRWEVLP